MRLVPVSIMRQREMLVQVFKRIITNLDRLSAPCAVATPRRKRAVLQDIDRSLDWRWFHRSILRFGAVVIAVILPAVASPVAVAATPVQQALKVAETYWGPSRCAGELHLEYSPTPPAAALTLPGAVVEAWVQFNTPTGPLDWNSPTYSQCVIYLNTTIWPNEQTMQAQYPEFCQIMMHEYGHFLGWADSTTAYSPSDIRYPLQTQANMPTQCLPAPPARQRPHGRPHHRYGSFER